MIVSLLYGTARALLSVLAVLLRRDTAKDADLLVLRHENAILRRHVKGRVRYEPAGRFWLAALTSLIPRGRLAAVFPTTPGTLLAWYRGTIDLDITDEEARCLEAPYTLHYDLQGISDESEMERIKASIPGYANV
ncbi:hypothetical protein [Streptomyces sp. NBC_01800]|uniref:hypothetical protein n=1 Tax=Streptomyces sp. NBC_01800 TaxID=2975945 RepID=UPI002DDA7349|nr:hypothetical protein [Streptomyces sp. NBC_01800]WSA65775.1 hypothetical protein OIE65_01340 [Streptomyces sp. NBC_01800]